MGKDDAEFLAFGDFLNRTAKPEDRLYEELPSLEKTREVLEVDTRRITM